MAKIREWEDSLDDMSPHDLQAVKRALDTLQNWELFQQEHPHMGGLQAMAEDRLTRHVAGQSATRNTYIKCPRR